MSGQLRLYGTLFGAFLAIAVLAEVVGSFWSPSDDSPIPLVIAAVVVVILIRRRIPKDPLERRRYMGEDWADAHPIRSSLIPVAVLAPLTFFALVADDELDHSWVETIGWTAAMTGTVFVFLIGIWATTRIVRTGGARRAGVLYEDYVHQPSRRAKRLGRVAQILLLLVVALFRARQQTTRGLIV